MSKGILIGLCMLLMLPVVSALSLGGEDVYVFLFMVSKDNEVSSFEVQQSVAFVDSARPGPYQLLVQDGQGTTIITHSFSLVFEQSHHSGEVEVFDELPVRIKVPFTADAYTAIIMYNDQELFRQQLRDPLAKSEETKSQTLVGIGIVLLLIAGVIWFLSRPRRPRYGF